jgi:hypothetical protein
VAFCLRDNIRAIGKLSTGGIDRVTGKLLRIQLINKLAAALPDWQEDWTASRACTDSTLSP